MQVPEIEPVMFCIKKMYFATICCGYPGQLCICSAVNWQHRTQCAVQLYKPISIQSQEIFFLALPVIRPLGIVLG